jgi:hypothetical protein
MAVGELEAWRDRDKRLGKIRNLLDGKWECGNFLVAEKLPPLLRVSIKGEAMFFREVSLVIRDLGREEVTRFECVV